jgi:molybdopterin/thiamine biosynthesis adenylyltransferase
LPDVLVVGAGGLGGPVSLALAAAGLTGRVCDPDVVELSNLQRQVQFATADVGRGKAEALGTRLRARGAAGWETAAARFDAASAAALLADVGVVIDGTDDPATKFAVGDAAVARGLPHVVAGVLRWGGSVFVGGPGAACYRCLFEDVPDDAPSCADAGVVGAACAAIGGLAAAAALALRRGELADAGSIVVVDDLRRPLALRRVRFERRAGCPACAAAPA